MTIQAESVFKRAQAIGVITSGLVVKLIQIDAVAFKPDKGLMRAVT